MSAKVAIDGLPLAMNLRVSVSSGTDRPRVREPHPGRQLEARIVAEDAQARAGLRKRGEASVSERIEGPAPEGGEFAARSAHSILASTLRPASSQSPKNVSVVKSPRDTNSQ